MSVHLVRHASAGDRSRWSGDDLDRPLDERGAEQARRLADHLGEAPIRAVWSSIAARCVDTVAPLADRLGVPVETRRELTEGARHGDLFELVRSAATEEGDLVMCSHGDLIPEVLNRLLREGMRVTGTRGCAKGSVWTLGVDGRAITHGAYVARP